ncbi:hypothetical protein DRO97_10065 [Archaeoglobales archaeon]|nr:MAG: hypothetical protein DRO97_10065 [Archaeoglobales archaeon]
MERRSFLVLFGVVILVTSTALVISAMESSIPKKDSKKLQRRWIRTVVRVYNYTTGEYRGTAERYYTMIGDDMLIFYGDNFDQSWRWIKAPDGWWKSNPTFLWRVASYQLIY